MGNLFSLMNLFAQVIGMICRIISATCSVLTYLKNKKK